MPRLTYARERDHSPSEAVLLADPALSADLALLVERVCQNSHPWVVVATAALTAWQQRDPVGWEKASEWPCNSYRAAASCLRFRAPARDSQ